LDRVDPDLQEHARRLLEGDRPALDSGGGSGISQFGSDHAPDALVDARGAAQDYIRTARAKGASDTVVNYEHGLRNAMLPVVTIVGVEAAFLIGGLIVTETVFNIPGVARFLVEAIRWRDYPIVQNLVMLIAVVVVVVNFVVDLTYVALDPRIKYES
jgi:ABC-type dipeptide/oligopeptide/nickel transport system permease component